MFSLERVSCIFTAIFILVFNLFLTSCASSSPNQNLNKPLASPAPVVAFANDAAVAANTYNYQTYQQTFQVVAQNYFTPEGWVAFKSALEQSGNLETAVAKKMVVSAVATGVPVILDQGVQAGRYAWNVQVPLLVTYENAKVKQQRNILVNMTVVRMPQVVGASGLGVQTFVAN
jgi:intracellular multiplication protein IcmL